MAGMSPIKPPDKFHVDAALGWLGLGNAAEAKLELAKVNAALREHPEVLEAGWEVCWAEQDWEAGLKVAEALLRKAPERVSGWLDRAYATRRVPTGGLEKAWTILRPAYELFPTEYLISYNLACYSAQLGRLEEAWDWYKKSLAVANNVEAVQAMGLHDPDLQGLWERMKGES